MYESFNNPAQSACSFSLDKLKGLIEVIFHQCINFFLVIVCRQFEDEENTITGTVMKTAEIRSQCLRAGLKRSLTTSQNFNIIASC